MFRRYVVSLLLALLVVAATVLAWRSLKQNEIAQIAQIAESESYAARSRLIQDIDAILDSLRETLAFWSRFDGNAVPTSDTDLEVAAGIEALLYIGPRAELRFLRNAQHPMFDYRPTVDERQAYAALLEQVAEITADAMLPASVVGDAADKIYFAIAGSESEGKLVAIFNQQELFGGLLADSSPGYAIEVRWDDRLLYQRDEAADTGPASWTRDGLIQNSMGTLWQVIHSPTATMAASMQTAAINAVLVAGLIIASLIGLLVAAIDKARIRALSAEHAEQRIAKLNLGLEQQVADRTRELADRSSDLQTISESIGHELRNPMNAISTNAQLLELKFAEQLDNDGVSTLQQIVSNVRRMTETLDRLLGFTVVTDARFNPQAVNMQDLVAEVLQDLQTAEPMSAASVQLGDLPNANADPTLVRILWMNLLGNAFKYSRGKDAQRIEVGAATHYGTPTFFVKDNGTGFDAAALDRLFRARERMTNEVATDGLGLGLHIAARIVRRHSGTIWAESEPHRGATFFFTLQMTASSAAN